jgi:crotonobetainyl-CoA:carnitine CoA-transferase CaiB-like acyl-CoA transferase
MRSESGFWSKAYYCCQHLSRQVEAGRANDDEEAEMGALDGVRVVDFGQWIAGPLAAMLLADQGAEVVHVDPPGGPRWKTPLDATFQRGKTCVELDLKAEGGRAEARRLVASADVLIENFRPGVMDRLGLAAGPTLARSPRLIYCSLPGFAADDPRAGVAAWEGVLGAATGVYLNAGEARFTAVPIPSTFGAIAAAVSSVMALIARERDGLGQRIEVPLFDATFLAIGSTGLLVNGKPEGGRPDDPWAGIFRCADGRWIRLSLATFRFLERFVDAIGRTDWVARGYVQRERPGPLARGTALRERQQAELTELFRTRPAAEWEEIGRRADVPLTLIRTTAEWLATDHARSAGLVAHVDDPELDATIQPGLAVRLTGTPGAIRPRASIGDGRVPWWPTDAPPGGATERVRAALEGVRVVDLTQVLAGPTATRTLAEFGAEVVKINNPREEGAGYRWQVHRYHTDVNRGKRTMLLDLATADGRDVLWRLVDGADVVMQNFRLGVADRLGIGYEQVKARRPDVVYGSVSFAGYGGPWERLPGYEPNAQAATGMAARMGGASGPPGPQPFAPNDYATGLLGAFALGLALFHRRRGGQGQHVQTSLVAAATLLQATLIPGSNDAGGPEALGWGPLQRLYRASDGWLFLGARDAEIGRLAALDGLQGIAGLADTALETALQERFAERRVADWVSGLTAAGIGAQRLVSATALMNEPWVIAHGLSLTRVDRRGDAITTIGPPFRLSRTPVVPGALVAPPGADAADVLASLGLSDRLDDLVAKRAIALD